MARPWWVLPAVAGLIGAVWVGYLGYDIWSEPEHGRESPTALAAALDEAVRSRDADELQTLFRRDAPDGYAADYLAQVPAGIPTAVTVGTDADTTLLTLRVGRGAALRCTSWPVGDVGGRFTLAVVPTLAAPCTA